jgi:signal transduction histidine kinase
MVVVVAVAVVGFGVPLGVGASRLYRSREVSRLQREADRVEAAVPDDGIGPGLRLPTPREPRVRLAVYDRTGARIAGRGPASGGRLVLAALRGRIDDDHEAGWLVVAAPIHGEDGIAGAVRADVPWDVVAEDVTESWLLMVAVALAAVGIAGVLAWWQTSRLVGPIVGLTGLAVRLGEGDFAARVEPAGVPEIDGAGQALNRTAERLGELLGRERAFTADVSHQLNTPLTSLRLSLESALMTPGGDDRAAIEEALAQLERLQATVSTLLAMARDAAPVAGPPADVIAVCAEVADRFRASLPAGRQLRLDVPATELRTRVPADVLREIVAVLVENGCRHGAGTVTVAVRVVGRGVVVEVSDEGAGVRGDPARVFERHQPDAAGHGIGLALARSLAEAHEARLELTRPGDHPRFAVALPGVAPPPG